MSTHYLGDSEGFKVPMKDAPTGGKTVRYLLWGDRLKILDDTSEPQHVKVKARGKDGWIPKAAITTGDGLLEVYVIDVGQGDGILLRTPHDDAWHIVDAGVPNKRQMTKKGAANFIRWKFIDELEMAKVSVKNLILTHPDLDHYGGMLDLFSGQVDRPPRTFTFETQNFYHNGIGRFAAAPELGATAAGTVAEPPYPNYGIGTTDAFIVELLDGRPSFATPARPFEQDFADLAAKVATVPGNVRRLSRSMGFLPDYDASKPVSIKILGPVEEIVNGVPGLRQLASPAVTRNGHSVILRLDYGAARILLTGDSNTESQRLLLSYNYPLEFESDVAKGCHHGSDDVDLRFVAAMAARVTVVSSGDNESHAHPRPRILGASARYGREARDLGNKVMPPLVYSTELARSVDLDVIDAVRKTGVKSSSIAAADGEIRAAKSGSTFEPMDTMPVSTDLVYGLINIRTDGTKIMCGYMKEAGETGNFDIEVFKAGALV